MTTTDYVDMLADRASLSRKDVRTWLEIQEEVVAEALSSAEDGEAIPVLPGALKVYKKWTKATKARTGTSPFTGGPMRFKAKPARWQVKAGALKKLKSIV